MSLVEGFRDLRDRGKAGGWPPARLSRWIQRRWEATARHARRLLRDTEADRRRWQKDAAQRKLELDRSVQFWGRAIKVYTTYKVCQARAGLAKDPVEREQIWDQQHQYAADRLYSLCVDLGGFFLKSGQFMAKPDLVPAAWVKRLSVLHDAAPADAFPVVRRVLEGELGGRLEAHFSAFEETPVGSASIAQVHRAKLRNSGAEVAVKVQHPGSESLVMTDLKNHRLFAAFLQKCELPFDLLSMVIELERQVKHEFDFVREAASMDRIAASLAAQYKRRPPVLVPRSVPGMVTRRVLVMDYMDGVQIMRMGDEMRRRGIDPSGRIARMAKNNILRDLTAAYGHMILRDGHFQADPHPGNILICKGGRVALLDYGQTKVLTERMRLQYANLVLAICADDVDKIGEIYKDVGILTTKTAQEDPASFRRMATMMFDTTLNSLYTTSNPFAEESLLKNNNVQAFPQDLFFVLRTVQLLRGLSKGMDVPWSVSTHWKPMAEEVLAAAASSSPGGRVVTGRGRK